MTRSRAILAAVAVLGLLLLGYAIGRYAAPDKVVVQERAVQVEKQVVVTQVKTEVQVVRVAAVAKNVRRKTVTETRPDGTTVTTRESEDKSRTKTEDGTVSKAEKADARVEFVYQDREVIKTVERERPQWAIGVTPGIDRGLSLSVGASVERRVFGPVFAGLWADTRGVGGIGVRLEF